MAVATACSSLPPPFHTHPAPPQQWHGRRFSHLGSPPHACLLASRSAAVARPRRVLQQACVQAGDWLTTTIAASAAAGLPRSRIRGSACMQLCMQQVSVGFAVPGRAGGASEARAHVSPAQTGVVVRWIDKGLEGEGSNEVPSTASAAFSLAQPLACVLRCCLHMLRGCTRPLARCCVVSFVPSPTRPQAASLGALQPSSSGTRNTLFLGTQLSLSLLLCAHGW